MNSWEYQATNLGYWWHDAELDLLMQMEHFSVGFFLSNFNADSNTLGLTS